MGGYANHHRNALRRAVDGGRAVHAAQVALPSDLEAFADEFSAILSRQIDEKLTQQR